MFYAHFSALQKGFIDFIHKNMILKDIRSYGYTSNDQVIYIIHSALLIRPGALYEYGAFDAYL